MRESPAIDIVKGLVEEGASIRVFDPAAMEKAKEFFGDKIAYCKTAEDALVDCDALIILTDWDVFKNINLRKVRSILKTPKIIDGRNIFNHKEMKKLGFDYYSIGRK
jgi:UDPglucose 6-dehydrogenase